MTAAVGSPPVVDRHVVIVTATASFAPSGKRLTGPVDSIDKLEKLIEWAYRERRLRPFPVASSNTADGDDVDPDPARLWLVGGAGWQLIGATDPRDEDDKAGLLEEVSRALASLVGRGWELKGAPDSRFVLMRGAALDRIAVEIVIEPRPWLGGGTVIDDPVELGRRLGLWHAALGVLPASSGRASGAVLLDQIMRARAVRGRGAVLSEPGTLPGGAIPELRIQPQWAGPTELVEQQLDHATDLALLEQQFPHLASAGMATLGYGRPELVGGRQAAGAVLARKRPFALWRGLLPAAESIAQPLLLPDPHPQMRAREPTRTWLTTEDLDWLVKDVRDGGAGVTVEQLDVDEAVVWPQQGRLLDAWATRLRDALDAQFAEDPALCALVESVGRDYITALGDPDAWTDDEWRHHYQPANAAAIAAHIRFRGRRVGMRISREYRVLPVYAHDAAMVYALPRDEDTKAPIDISDTHTRLGRMQITRRIPLSDKTVLAVALAENTAQIADVLTEEFDLPTRPRASMPSVPTSGGAAGTIDEQLDADPDASTEQAVHGDVASSDTPSVSLPAEESSENDTAREPADAKAATSGRSGTTTRKKGAAKAAKVDAGVPAAVLHTDGLWLPDGTKHDLSEWPRHAGDIAELAYAHDIGYRLSANFRERAQVWITEQACERFGMDVKALAEARAPERGELLHELTENIGLVTDAVADGWRFGGGAKRDGSGKLIERPVQRLGVWTRVYREGSDQPGVMIALIAGMDTVSSVSGPLADEDDEPELESGKGMPVLAGRPSPAQVAHRLQMLADALGFPWKINGNVTAIDLLVQARPRTWTVREWKDEVLAPSATAPPYGILDVERDYNWTRPPTAEELLCLYVHAYDRGGSYFAALGTLELPIGDPVHHPSGTMFDPRLPGYWLLDVPESNNWRMPYVLNPSDYQFNEPKWVSTPRVERAFALGYDTDILEAIVWPRHGRVLRLWCERFSNASVTLDTDDPDAQAARNQAKVVRSTGLGIQGSEILKGKLGFDPARRILGAGKANANIAYRLDEIGQRTDRWPAAALSDTVLYVSNDPDPVTAWPGGPETYGRGFGKYKHEGSALLADHVQFLDGNKYKGKKLLTSPDEWRALLPTLTGKAGQ